MASKETLFSLELAVETLRIHSTTVVCRLPSLAFRLLDYPTLLLHHVDPEEVRHIKEKISLGSFGDIPAQLHELKDHRGNFCVNKCKSCLLKMNPETLLAYLRNTPLYIVLIDMWPEVPKLVANCTISLQQTMEEISQDIEQNGIDVPSVHGRRDSYKLYNLMGSEVGWIVFRYRLLSMGVSLMPHIPDSAITRRQKERVDLAVTPRKATGDVITTTEDTKTKSKGEDVLLEDLEVEGHPKKMISIAVSTVETERANQRDLKGTRTAKTSTQRRHTRKQVEKSMPLMQNDDLFVSNTHCPPPLYFNTVNEDSPITSGINIQTLGRNQREMRGYLNMSNEGESPVAYNLSEELSTMSSGTCSEEVIHEVETHYTLPSENPALSPRWSVRKTHRKLKTENSQVVGTKKKHRQDQQDVKQEHQNQVSETCNRCQLHLDPRRQSQLPILAALLQELSLLHGNVLQNELDEQPPQRKHKPQVEVVTSPKGKENILISEPQSIIHEEKPYRHKHQECTKPPQGVPRTKGWLRQQPVHSKRRTKLHYGMTHSQKLRLKKNNPELLKELEGEEARLRTLQMEKEKMTMRDEDDFIDEVGKLNVSTEIAHHLGDEKKVDYTSRTESVSEAGQTKLSSTKVKHKQMKDQYMHTEFSDKRGPIMESTIEPQPPLPRPRKLKEGTFVWEDKDLRIETENNDVELPDAQLASVEPKDLSSSDKSARSIDVYLPIASLQESDIEGHSDDSNNTGYSSSSYIHRPKTIQVPGIPSEDMSQVDASPAEKVSSVQYSNDFIGSDRFTSTGEQELEPLASDKSECDHSAQSNFSSSNSRSTSRSRISQVALNPLTSSMPLSNDIATNLQKRRLSIPKPKLSSISPVPVRRTSKTSTLSVNTATTLDPHKDSDRSPTPPTPKPRPSLMRSSSLFSEDSRLQSTVPSSEFKTEDSQNANWTNRDDSEDNYTDDFSDSDHGSDQSNQF